MANDPISAWANEAQRKESESYIKEEYDSIDSLRKDLERLRNNNLNLKLQVIEEKEKIQKISATINTIKEILNK